MPSVIEKTPMLKRPLTEKQEEFLQFIEEHVEKKGEFPSFREIQDALNYASVTSVWQNMQALVKKGYLTHDQSGTYDFARDMYFISQNEQAELRELFRGMLDLWLRGAKLTPELAEQYRRTFEKIVSDYNDEEG